MECCFLEKYWDGDDDSECMATINTDEAMNILIGDSGGIEIKNVFCNPKESESGESIDIEEENEHIPGVSSINDLSLEKNQIPILIDINMVLHRKAIENTSVKKTLTIPQWLNKEAERHNINFSQVLQEALKEQLNFK